MSEKSEARVVSFSKIKRLARVLNIDDLIQLLEIARFKFGSINVYGVTSDGRIVAVLDKRLLFIHGGHIGIPDQDREIFTRISAKLRAINSDIENNIDKVLKEAKKPLGRKEISFITSLRDDKLAFLYDTPLERVIRLASQQTQTNRSKRKIKPAESLVRHDWWNDPDRQHWE